MTLGDVVESWSPNAGRTFPEATDEIDSDVLAAYLRVRNQP